LHIRGNTGEHCSTVIDELFVSKNISDGNGQFLYTVTNLIGGHVVVSGTGFAPGDSGGPVYGSSSFVGSSPYRASGIISAGTLAQTCAGIPVLGNASSCFSKEYWVDASTIFANLNLSIAP